MPKKIGRPKVKIDLVIAEKLGNLQCTIKECAAFMDIPVTTLQGRRDFRLAYEKGQENGKISLRRIQFKLAERNATMGIWLGKQYLGQREMTYETSEPIDLKEFAEVIANNYEPEAT